MINLSELFSEEYSRIKPWRKRIYPLLKLELELQTTKSKASFRVQLDTGSDSAITLTIFEAHQLGLVLGNPIDPDGEESTLADQTTVREWLYDITLKVRGLEIPTTLSVIGKEPKRMPTDEEKASASIDVVGVLGRALLDDYKVIFDGLMNPKKFSFFK